MLKFLLTTKGLLILSTLFALAAYWLETPVPIVFSLIFLGCPFLDIFLGVDFS